MTVGHLTGTFAIKLLTAICLPLLLLCAAPSRGASLCEDVEAVQVEGLTPSQDRKALENLVANHPGSDAAFLALLDGISGSSLLDTWGKTDRESLLNAQTWITGSKKGSDRRTARTLLVAGCLAELVRRDLAGSTDPDGAVQKLVSETVDQQLKAGGRFGPLALAASLRLEFASLSNRMRTGKIPSSREYWPLFYETLERAEAKSSTQTLVWLRTVATLEALYARAMMNAETGPEEYSTTGACSLTRARDLSLRIPFGSTHPNCARVPRVCVVARMNVLGRANNSGRHAMVVDIGESLLTIEGALNRDEKLNVLLKLCWAHMSLGDCDASRVYLEKAQAIDPKEFQVRNLVFQLADMCKNENK